MAQQILIEKGGNTETVEFENLDKITFNGTTVKIVRIYNIIGNQLMCVRQKSANGIISIADLPQGIYIIKINDQTAKFVKR